VKQFVKRVRTHPATRRTAWLLTGYAARMSFQSVVFVWVARQLGADLFGAFAATLALANLIAPFVELGAYSLIIRDMVAGVDAARAVGNSLILSLCITPVAFLVLAVLHVTFTPNVPWIAAMCVGISTFYGTRMVSTFRAVCVARGEFAYTAVLEILVGIVQLAAVGALVWWDGRLALYSLLYAAQNLLVGFVGVGWLTRRFGRPVHAWEEVKRRLWDGFHFATGMAAQTAYTEADKAILARLSGLIETGIYSAAQRILLVAFVPLTAVTGAVYTSFFTAAQKGGLKGARRLAWRLTPLMAAYGVGAGIVLWVAAPLVPRLLGNQYASSEGALQWLAPIMLLQSLAYPFADALTGSGQQRTRTFIQVATMALNVVLNLLLDAKWGFRGAIVSTIIAQSLALLLLVASGSSKKDAVAQSGA
jgi:O-antigen/teichoic acid export membrane protein